MTTVNPVGESTAMPGTPVMSGGLGGAVVSKPSPARVSARVLTFLQAVQMEVRKYHIDLNGVEFSPFIRDVTVSEKYYLKTPSEIVYGIEEAMLIAALSGSNSTPIGIGIGGGARRLLYIAVKRVIRESKLGKIYVVGLNANPAGNQAGRPGMEHRV
jgi:hypothetical protein